VSGWGLVVFAVLAVPLLMFGVFQFFQEAMVRIPTGTVGLVIVRGKATERVLTPGAHIIWPFRKQMIQSYPLRDLTYLTGLPGDSGENDYADLPMRARLGDRTEVMVLYTVRFRIHTDDLPRIHEHLGPDGIKPFMRDVTRKVISEHLRASSFGVDHVFGDDRNQLEAVLTDELTTALLAGGFDVLMFHLRDIDLGEVGEVVNETVRATLQIELERRAAQVRALRVEHEAQQVDRLAATLSDDVLRYRQIELGREALDRWDGRTNSTDIFMNRYLNHPDVSKAVQHLDPDAVADAGPDAANEVSE
jgi:regulator of protease activity HflC (stomatin/prohibitin superfamily)